MAACTIAIIPAAGYGTRRLPITKSIDKNMLPILNRPIIDYVVRDCIRAGIQDIYIVVAKGSTQIRSYYTHNVALEQFLQKNGKQDALESITPPLGVRFHYVEQDVNDKPGTAVPVALCRPFVPAGESAVICMGDDCLYFPDGQGNDIARLVEQVGDGAGMIGVSVDPAEVSRYGVIELDDMNQFVRMIEKPLVEDAPSNLINVSKYVFDSELLDETARYVQEASPDGEYLITEPINAYVARGRSLKVVPAKGQYLDVGTTRGWLHANNIVASHEII